MSDLANKRCESCEGIGEALSEEQARNLLPQLDKKWKIINGIEIKRSFSFENFYQTMAFVNALAWVANSENHHPDLEVGYNYCHVRFMTHSLKGLSINDFICASKIDRLLVN